MIERARVRLCLYVWIHLKNSIDGSGPLWQLQYGSVWKQIFGCKKSPALHDRWKVSRIRRSLLEHLLAPLYRKKLRTTDACMCVPTRHSHFTCISSARNSSQVNFLFIQNYIPPDERRTIRSDGNRVWDELIWTESLCRRKMKYRMRHLVLFHSRTHSNQLPLICQVKNQEEFHCRSSSPYDSIKVDTVFVFGRQLSALQAIANRKAIIFDFTAFYEDQRALEC